MYYNYIIIKHYYYYLFLFFYFILFGMVDLLEQLFSVIWQEEIVPRQWREGLIVNIFKKGDREDPANYRGITLLSVVGKVFCKILNNRLVQCLDKEGALHEGQAGFRINIKLANKFRTPLPSSSQAPFNIPSLASRRQYASLVLLFKLFHHHLDFPSPILTTNPTPPYPTRSYHPNNFLQLPLRTSSFKSSFFPATIPLWNSLPPSLKETSSLSLFKSSIKDILF